MALAGDREKGAGTGAAIVIYVSLKRPDFNTNTGKFNTLDLTPAFLETFH